MNGKQAKKSRALKRALDQHAQQKAKELSVQKQIDIGEIIGAYNHALFQLSFFKRLGHCWRVMQCGDSMFNRRTTFYWITLAGLLGALAFTTVVRYAGIIT